MKTSTTMMAGDGVFIDSNILIYSLAEASPWHRSALDRMAELGRTRQLWISRQVLREVLATGTRNPSLWPFTTPFDWVSSVRKIETFYEIAEDDASVTAILLGLIEHPGAGGRQVHDANIVATMLRHQISSLLTHNVSDFRRYEPRIVVLPLVNA